VYNSKLAIDDEDDFPIDDVFSEQTGNSENEKAPM
jgi:hypothetical protein